MRSKAKTYCSLFLLGIFLFAYTEKGVHDIIHGHRFDYLAEHGVHYQKPIHHCFLCDLNIPIAANVTTYIPASFTCTSFPAIFPCLEQQIKVFSLSSSVSRAPPLSA